MLSRYFCVVAHFESAHFFYRHSFFLAQACLAPYIYPTSSHIFDDDELKANAENITRFLEVSRQIENDFIMKRAILADQRPELILSEEIAELKSEIQRKDHLLSKYYEKLSKWTAVVNDTCSGKLPNPNAGHTTATTMSGGGGPSSAMQMQMPPNMRMNPGGPPGPPPPNMGGHPGGPLGPQMKPMPGQAGGGNVNSPMGGHSHAVGSPMMGQPPTPQQIRPQGSPMVGQQMPPQMGGNPNVGGLQGPLAYLERTTSNIGMLDSRR